MVMLPAEADSKMELIADGDKIFVVYDRRRYQFLASKIRIIGQNNDAVRAEIEGILHFEDE